jgi:ankyrin repeat protein
MSGIPRYTASLAPVDLMGRDNKEESEEGGVPQVSNIFLDVRDRPQSLRFSIDVAFDRIQRQTESNWNSFNGTDTYSMCGVSEHKLMVDIIQRHYPERKKFYIKETGSGNFQFIRAFAKALNEHPDLPNDIEIHIIGTRGESYNGPEQEVMGKCVLHLLGSFRSEDMLEELRRRGLESAEGNIDLEVSRWAIRHFADGIGAIDQLLKLLRPGGFSLFDGCYYLEGRTKRFEYGTNERLTKLFLQANINLLTGDGGRHAGNDRALNHFMLQRAGAEPCRFPLSYDGTEYADHIDWQIGSSCVTRFKRTVAYVEQEIYPLSDDASYLYGDKDLFEYLKQNELFRDPSRKWRPLQADQDHRRQPLFHSMFQRPHFYSMETVLDDYDWTQNELNESDEQGRTPLHLSIEFQNMRLRDALLQRGVRLNLQNGQGETPLHLSARIGSVDAVQALLQAKADPSARARGELGPTPLEAAREAGQDAAVKLLSPPLHEAVRRGNFMKIHMVLQNGANINERDATGKTALDLAIEAQNYELCQFLIGRGADVNEGFGRYQIPLLHEVLEWNDLRVFELLLNAGADPLAKQHGSWGKTALQSAERRQRDGDEPLDERIVELLRERTLAAQDE